MAEQCRYKFHPMSYSNSRKEQHIGGKPVSLVYRCPCRYFESNVPKSNVKHLKIYSTSNCSLQIVARLKNNSKQICLDPKTKWIQEYLEKALNK
ncbi:stromal cell-derived factor 1 isoform X2 [Xenopus laevis]|uniref:Stromal cell-derived factor 1 n=1 Tax=Xenopus laevis TaxID=8355 RepID=A0A8J1LES6_XENLA|nr:stromal cell-derived factor 1 isoform X2 [Xenopus laevis]